jgi:hypothetical protein
MEDDQNLMGGETAPPGDASAAAPPGLSTPEEWANRLGHIHRAHPHVPQSTTHADWQHAIADRLHGWTQHAYHFANDPLQLSEADYRTALQNAAEYPLKQAHEPALSPLMKPKEKA